MAKRPVSKDLIDIFNEVEEIEVMIKDVKTGEYFYKDLTFRKLSNGEMFPAIVDLAYIFFEVQGNLQGKFDGIEEVEDKEALIQLALSAYNYLPHIFTYFCELEKNEEIVDTGDLIKILGSIISTNDIFEIVKSVQGILKTINVKENAKKKLKEMKKK